MERVIYDRDQEKDKKRENRDQQIKQELKRDVGLILMGGKVLCTLILVVNQDKMIGKGMIKKEGRRVFTVQAFQRAEEIKLKQEKEKKQNK